MVIQVNGCISRAINNYIKGEIYEEKNNFRDR